MSDKKRFVLLLGLLVASLVLLLLANALASNVAIS
jgi:hypothetical protein